MGAQTTTAQKPWPIQKTPLTILCVFAPIVGAILYYVWRKEHPEAANYANKVSLLTFVIAIGAWIGLPILLGALL